MSFSQPSQPSKSDARRSEKNAPKNASDNSRPKNGGGKKKAGKNAKVSLGADGNRRGLAETFAAAGRDALEDGDFEEAFDAFQQALGYNSQHIAARIGLGKIWLEFEEFERAFEEIGRAHV